jgi:hypothetical protein
MSKPRKDDGTITSMSANVNAPGEVVEAKKKGGARASLPFEIPVWRNRLGAILGTASSLEIV